MSSSEESDPAPSFVSISSSLYSISIFETYALLNEKLSIHQNIRRIPVRHRAWWLLSSMIIVGMLFAHLIWNLTPSIERLPNDEPLDAQVLWDIGGADTTEVVIPDNVRVVALVSYLARSRTSILDCYLQNNLAINGGLLDQVIFTPETGYYEEDLDWLYALVQSTQGYSMLGKAEENIGEDGNLPIEETQVSEESVGVGPFARAWNLALSTSQAEIPSPETETDRVADAETDDGLTSRKPTPSPDPEISTIYIFIHGETIFIDQDAISQLLNVHLAHPSYAFVQANMINQPVLSWIHHHLGVVRPYRPETEPPFRLHRNKTAAKQESQTSGDVQHPWRASELPLWRDSHHRPHQHSSQTSDSTEEQPQDFPPTSEPNLFNIPIDFHSPFRGHRWLPYNPHAHHPLSQSHPSNSASKIPEADESTESISTPITQAMMSLLRPGKWPWTLSALHLYSFLEHLECTPPYSFTTALLNSADDTRRGKYSPNCAHTGPLSRYNMGLWEYQAEAYGMSFFAIDSRTVRNIGVLPNGVSEAEVLGRSGKGAVIHGGSIAVRFVGSRGDDRVSEKRGLETTDLLSRFEGVGREVEGCGGFDVLN
jgi:hypothetical protein